MGSTQTAADVVRRLNAVADVIAAHPNCVPPTVRITSYSACLEWHGNYRGHAAEKEIAAQVIREYGGTWSKTVADSMFYAESDLVTDDGINVELCIYLARDSVCTPRVVGQEEVVVPAVEARPEHVEVRDIIEWDCGSLMAGDHGAQS